MSKIKLIGPAGRHSLKKTSPYTCMLLDVSLGLTTEDVATFKLVIQADKLAGRRQVCQMLYAADILSFMDSRRMITSTSTEFLQDILIKIGRKDLERQVRKYHEDRAKRNRVNEKENTERKSGGVFTQIKEKDELQGEMRGLSLQTYVKEVYHSSDRSRPEGASQGTTLCETVTSTVCKDTTELALSQTISSSPMAVDSSQENYTDEEKIGYGGDKNWLFENDAIMASQ